MEGEKVDVAWTEFDTNMRQAFKELREDNSFFDVTLACEDSHMQAHKVIISAASPFFRAVLTRHPHPSPLLYLTGIKTDSLRAVLDFMYQGEVSVARDDLPLFLSTARQLQVRGLTEPLPPAETEYDTQRQRSNGPQWTNETNNTMENDTEDRKKDPVGTTTTLRDMFKVEKPAEADAEKLVIKEEPLDMQLVLPLENPWTMDTHEEGGCDKRVSQNPSTLMIEQSFSVQKDYYTEHLQRTYTGLDIKKKEEGEERQSDSASIKALLSDSNSDSPSEAEAPKARVIHYSSPQVQRRIWDKERFKLNMKADQMSKDTAICGVCKKRVMKGFLKQHLVRVHFKAALLKAYPSVLEDRQCLFCERGFHGTGPSAIIEHIGSFHNKVFDFYKG